MKIRSLGFIIALALLAVPSHAEPTGPPSSRQPELTGSVALAGATDGFNLSGDRPTTLMAEAALRLGNALGPLSLTVEARHAFKRDGYWLDKSFLSLGADVSLGRNALFFVQHERKYRIGDEFAFAGIRFTFGGHAAN